MAAPERQQQLALGEPEAWHVLSPCGRYRYVLGHRWAPGPLAVFALCNPSYALADNGGDHTATKTIGFAKRWNCGGRVIVNACALRSRDPRALLGEQDPIGPDNAREVQSVFTFAKGPIVLGWGDALPKSLRHTASMLVGLMPAGQQAMCLGRTASGQPRHPLMLAYDTPLEPWT